MADPDWQRRIPLVGVQHFRCSPISKIGTGPLRVAGVTVGLTESNGSQPTAGFMTHVTCRLTAKNRDQLQNPTLGNRVWATFTFLNVQKEAKMQNASAGELTAFP